MKVLIAEDDPPALELLEKVLGRWGYEVVTATNGEEAWAALRRDDAPALAILDWMMPDVDGLEVCRRLRADPRLRAVYVIILTARSDRDDLVLGLEAGADDYVSKPFDAAALRARLLVGSRVVKLQRELQERVLDLEQALSRVDQLHGLLPICSYCRKVRDDSHYWHRVEAYIEAHSAARFSHGVCPDCYERVLKPEMEEAKRRRAAGDSSTAKE
jgi:CheY-like chemotaxis protein